MPGLIHKQIDGSEKRLDFGSKPLIIGRLPESELQVRDAFISRVHAGISHANGNFVLKDLGSTNGTYRNGARVYECNLANGDRIQVGNASLLFEIESGSGDGILRQVPPTTAPRQVISPPVQPGLPPPGELKTTIPVKIQPPSGKL